MLYSRKKVVLGAVGVALIVLSVFSVYFFVIPVLTKPQVIAVVKVYGYIISDSDRELYLRVFNEIERNDSYVAVIVLVNSPGGYASIVEEIYFLLRKISEKKPLVVVIDGIAASGGYYVSLSSDYIVASPTSFVGNIGVIALAPSIIVPSEVVYESGPYKYAGFSYKDFPKVVERAADNFVNRVLERREGRLKVTKEELLLGKLYPGTTAKELGLVDDVGGIPQAIAKISEKVYLRKYVLVDVTALVEKRYGVVGYGAKLWKNRTLLNLSTLVEVNREPLSLLYLSPFYVVDDSAKLLEKMVSRYTYAKESYSSTVAIDVSHGNLFVPPLMTYFFGKITEKGMKVSFIEKDLCSALKENPRALIVFTPTKPYSEKEIDCIKEYVKRGGLLILLYDPAYALPTDMNILSTEFGIFFAAGYIYDMYHHYGIYRNIEAYPVDKSHPLLANITTLVFLTAAHIYSNATPLVQTYNTSVHNLLETPGKYTVVVAAKNVIVVGDSSILLDPYLSIADNKKLVDNLVQIISKKQ